MNATNCPTAAGYYERLGWHPGVFRSTVWVVAGRPVEALDAPEDLGRRVVELLRTGCVHVPIFRASEQAGNRWVFLTGRRDSDWYTLATRLADFGVEHIWAGSTLDLPPSESGKDQLTWLIPPVSGALPLFSIVARAVLQAADSPHCHHREMP
jgi:hypothetical protein